MADSDGAAAPAPVAAEAPSGPGVEEAGETVTGEELCTEMFDRIGAYVHSELTATCQEYTLLEKLNGIAANEYAGMTASARTLNTELQSLHAKYKELEPYLKQVDAVAVAVEKLESSARELDDYSKRLEARFKSMPKVT